MMNKIAIVFAAIVMLASNGLQPASGQQLHEVLKPYLTDDTIGVVNVDLGKIALPEAISALEKMNLLEEQELKNVSEPIAYSEQIVKLLRESGVENICSVLRMSSIEALGPVVIIPVAEGKNIQAAKILVAGVVEQFFPGADFVIESQGSTLFVSANVMSIESLKEARQSDRDLSGELAAIDGSVGMVIFGDTDSRRVAREIFPVLPVPFNEFSGTMVADEVRWLALNLTISEALSGQMDIEMADEDQTEALASAIKSIIPNLLKLRTEPNPTTPSKAGEVETTSDEFAFAKALQGILKPEINGKRISIRVDNQNDFITKALTQFVARERNAVELTENSNKLRMLALGFHNYESAFRKFPNPLAKTADGKPGLSWRVHVLPFLEGGELYEQFKLDEPWNSEHNLKLVEKMPQVFESAMFDNIGAGKTIFQVPVSATAAFQPTDEEGIGLEDFHDGTSNTIMIVTTAPENAVIWTKPADWNVDEADVWKGLKSERRTEVIAARMDGSTFAIPLNMDAEKLKALITRAGGEIVEQ